MAGPGGLGSWTSNDAPGGTVAAGTKVDSYLVHYDPASSAWSYISECNLSFSGKILGVIIQHGKLTDSDSIVGAPGVQYLQSYRRQFEVNENNKESCVLTSDMQTFQIQQLATTWAVEQCRILVEPGSSPTSYGMNRLAAHATTTRPAQVLMTDYGKSVIDLAEDWVFDPVSGQQVNPHVVGRHYGNVNVLFCDGSVQQMPAAEVFQPDAAHWPDARGGGEN